MSIRIIDRVAPGAHDDTRRLLLGQSAHHHVALRHQRDHGDGIEREIVLVEAIPDQVENVLGVRRLGDAVSADDKTGSRLPGRDVQPSAVKGRAAGRPAGVNAHERLARRPGVIDRPLVGIVDAHELGRRHGIDDGVDLLRLHIRVAKSRDHCFLREVDVRLVGMMAAEDRFAGAADGDISVHAQTRSTTATTLPCMRITSSKGAVELLFQLAKSPK